MKAVWQTKWRFSPFRDIQSTHFVWQMWVAADGWKQKTKHHSNKTWKKNRATNEIQFIKDIFKPRVSWATMTSFRVWNGGFTAFFLWFLFLLRQHSFSGGITIQEFHGVYAPAKLACWTPSTRRPLQNNSSALQSRKIIIASGDRVPFSKGDGTCSEPRT